MLLVLATLASCGIIYDSNTKVFRLDTAASSYQIYIGDCKSLIHLYYGKKVENQGVKHLFRAGQSSSFDPTPGGESTGFSFNQALQEYPFFGAGDYRSSCLHIVNSTSGSFSIDLRYHNHTIYQGKPLIDGLPSVQLPNAQVLDIVLKDLVSDIFVTLRYAVDEETDSITRSTIIKNDSPYTIYLTRALTASIDFLDPYYKIHTFNGRWSSEQNVNVHDLRHGKVAIESFRGTSGHSDNPFVMLTRPTTDEDKGDAYGFSFVYSGNFLFELDVDLSQQTRLVAGISPQFFKYKLNHGEQFNTPELILTYSYDGMNGVSNKLHRLIREKLIRSSWKDKQKPVLINTWEGFGFDINEEKILGLAKEAKDLGIDLLVVDDGWFGKRNDDKSSLGDWYVNTDKIPDMPALVKKVNDMGIKFGLWFEPEMVSEDSNLYREHPDWAVQIPGRKPALGRNQLVLDFTRKEIIDNIYSQMESILKTSNIEYIKWDMNRHLTDVYTSSLPPDQQGEFYHRYVLGVYQLLERINQNFPNLLIEGCSGGGGRFDAGILYYVAQNWLSDDTDAAERAKIQWGASYGYPTSTMGSHVTASPNGLTKRSIGINTRSAVAMCGTYGFELDLSKVEALDKIVIMNEISNHRKYFDIFNYGDFYRLVTPFNSDYFTAWMHVSQDKKRAILTIIQLYTRPSSYHLYIRLRGLDPAKQYVLSNDKQAYYGDVLMNAGYIFNANGGDYISTQVEIHEK